ncbi:hypothetical protein FB451DRAFT_368484 [Mycena latifolia]|nr:hypothetical protein FB451DRAFT_368484 [Mycena latifolia]
MSRKQSPNAPYGASYDLKHEHRPVRHCRCKCNLKCNCRCTCACPEHCMCLDPCDSACGTRTSRNLVVSLDGTSNQFGDHNTNVVELHSRILVDPSAEQLTYYNCGIGTYAPNRAKTFKYWRQRFDNVVDLAIAWNFQTIVLKAYRWLCNEYRPGDKIFLFGFSRGAYQVRTLAGMIEKVGLVNAGNQELIPFAYEVYCERLKGKETDEAPIMAPRFKETFSRTVKIHFVGAWDTVSSVGVVRHKPLPLTSSAEHICIFRHALALDERRVKFLPEYVDGGNSNSSPENGLARRASIMIDAGNKSAQRAGTGDTDESWFSRESKSERPTGATDVKFSTASPPAPDSRSRRRVTNTKEVWFAGTHSDIGGGLKNNLDLNLSSVPLLWMENEAASAGLRLRPRKTGGAWNWNDLRNDKTHESLKSLWRPMELLPLKRLSFKNATDVTHAPHLGGGRIIAPGQRIHASVAFKKQEYHPRASFREAGGIPWESFVGQDIDAGDFDWASEWRDLIEMDLFDASFTVEAVQNLKSEWEKGEDAKDSEANYWIKRLSFISLSGELAANYIPTLKRATPEKIERETRLAVEFFQQLASKRPGTFDPDLAELLERQSRLLDDLGRTEDALKRCEEAVSIRRRVVAQIPLTPKKREKLAGSLEILSTYHRKLDRSGSAIGSTQEAIELRRDVADEYSEDPHADLQRSLNIISFLRCLHSLSDDLRNLDRLSEALPVAEEQVQVNREIAQSEPEVFASSFASSLCDLSYVLRDLGRYKDACIAVEEAVALQRGLAEKDPIVLEDLALSLHHMAFSLRDVGKSAEALITAEHAVNIRRRLAELDPAKFRGLLAHSLNGLSLALRAVGRNDAALVQAQKAITIQRRLVQEDPVEYKPGLAALLNTAAYHLSAASQFANALTAVDEALEIQHELVEANPTNFNSVLANILDTRANVLCSLDRHEEGLRAISDAEEINRTRSTEPARLVRERSAVYLSTRAKCLIGTGQKAEALGAISEALKLYRAVADQTPSAIGAIFSQSVDAISGCFLELKSTDALELMVRLVDLCQLLGKEAPGRFDRALRKALSCYADGLRALGRDGEADGVMREAGEISA